MGQGTDRKIDFSVDELEAMSTIDAAYTGAILHAPENLKQLKRECEKELYSVVNSFNLRNYQMIEFEVLMLMLHEIRLRYLSVAKNGLYDHYGRLLEKYKDKLVYKKAA